MPRLSGTVIVNGVGLGFANRVRREPIGVVAAPSPCATEAQLARIHNPISLDWGGRTPEETALAIIAGMAWNGRG